MECMRIDSLLLPSSGQELLAQSWDLVGGAGSLNEELIGR